MHAVAILSNFVSPEGLKEPEMTFRTPVEGAGQVVSTCAQLQCEVAHHLRITMTSITCDESVYGLNMMYNEDREN